MAKVYAPLMSIDASGTYANQLAYAKWKGIRYVRNHVISMNPRTANQMTIRNAFTLAVSQWHQEDQTTKHAWEAAALALGRPMSALPVRGKVRPLGKDKPHQPTQPLPAHIYSYSYSLKGKEIYSQPFP
jgi:hypothetical protein